MSRTRDIIEEIKQIQQRRQSDFAVSELLSRLSNLEYSFNKYDRSNEELIRYYPVALIACLEGYFRMVIRELIDAGEPYLTNAEKLTASIKLDFAVLRAVHGKEITIGDLIAHSLPLSKLEHVDGTLSNLIGTNFLQKLRTTTDRWGHENDVNVIPILEKPDEVYADVSRVFELRHIICHELTSAYEIKNEEIERCFESCVRFLRASSECVSNILYPDAPLTQADMNIAAGKALDDAYARMKTICKSIKAIIDPDGHEAFDEAQAKWDAYCDAWVHFNVGERSGTMWPTLYAGTAQTIVENRIAELTHYYKWTKGDYK